jgi:pyridoxal phosphate enzyme (YggS family)
VTLLAVSKTRTSADIAALATAGQCHFGENYLQEALPKMDALKDRDLVWHFIGPLQSNKTRHVAAHFDWVHSLDRLKVARRLSEQRPDHLPLLNVCIQVNVDQEAGKQGVPIAEVVDLAGAIVDLPRLRLRGLMAIPSAHSNDRNRAAFEKLAMTLATLPPTMSNVDQLSMGMSDDFETAIACGATIIRIGTALFGPRT